MKGHFIVLVGPDGVGKTTVASQLSRNVGSDRFTYFHFAPPLSGRGATPESGRMTFQSGKPNRSNKAMTSLRLVKNFVRFWLGYLATVRRHVDAGHLVVADRWAYSYLVKPESVRFGGTQATALRFIRSLPEPDHVFVLDAPAEVVVDRKPELTVSQAERERELWRDLPVRGMHIIDANRDASFVAEAILGVIDWR